MPSLTAQTKDFRQMATPIPTPDPSIVDKLRDVLNQRLTLDLLFVGAGAGLWRRGFRDRSLIDQGVAKENVRLEKRVKTLEERVEAVETNSQKQIEALERRYEARIVSLEEDVRARDKDLHAKDAEIIRLSGLVAAKDAELLNQVMINDGLMREIGERKA